MTENRRFWLFLSLKESLGRKPNTELSRYGCKLLLELCLAADSCGFCINGICGNGSLLSFKIVRVGWS